MVFFLNYPLLFVLKSSLFETDIFGHLFHTLVYRCSLVVDKEQHSHTCISGVRVNRTLKKFNSITLRVYIKNRSHGLVRIIFYFIDVGYPHSSTLPYPTSTAIQSPSQQSQHKAHKSPKYALKPLHTRVLPYRHKKGRRCKPTAQRIKPNANLRLRLCRKN